MCCSNIKRCLSIFLPDNPRKKGGSHTSFYFHKTNKGKHEILIPQIIVTRQTKVKRRFSYLILLSPDKQREKTLTAPSPHQHHTSPLASHCTALHHTTTPLHITTLQNWINLNQKKKPHIYTAPPPKLINLNQTTTPHYNKSKHCQHSSILISW